MENFLIAGSSSTLGKFIDLIVSANNNNTYIHGFINRYSFIDDFNDQRQCSLGGHASYIGVTILNPPLNTYTSYVFRTEMDPIAVLEDFKGFAFVFEHTIPNAAKATHSLIGCKFSDPLPVTPY